MERRIPHRRAVQKAIERVMASGALGVKVVLGGRINGAEISRVEKFHQGSVPTQTLRENVDYAQVPALLQRGYVGVKVWIHRKAEEINMMQPKRRKFIKEFRGRRHGVATRGNAISFGDFAMKSQEVAWVTSAQIEAARRTITHGLKKGGRVWIRIFPDKPITSRAAGKRMGGGKGDISTYVAVVRPGSFFLKLQEQTRQ